MKKILYLCILTIVISAFGINFQPATLKFNAAELVNTTINAQPALRLIFKDDFGGSTLNSNKWISKLQWGRTNPPELQYYAPSQLKFSGGVLHIKAEKKWTNRMRYTSGALSTYGKFKFTYGVVKVRIRTPYGKGLWPAVWLLDYAGGAQEIDITESVGDLPNISFMTLHYPTSSGTKSLGTHYGGTNLTAAFHIFKVDWSRNAITWYIDGIQRYRLTQHIPTKPMYLIINLAVGGDWPGSPDSTTKFPAYFNIDYVHIYKRQ